MKLIELTSLMWRACVDNQITEAEAEELVNLIEVQKAVPSPVQASRKSVGARPQTDASLERRRRWAAAGRLPPALAARFTQAEVAVLAVVADTVVRTGDCRHFIDRIAAMAGVCRSTVKNAIRTAEALKLLTIEERRQSAWRNLPNILRIVSPEWESWNRLARPGPRRRGGVKSLTGTNTRNYKGQKKQELRPSKRLPKRQNKASGEEPDENSGGGQKPVGHRTTDSA